MCGPFGHTCWSHGDPTYNLEVNMHLINGRSLAPRREDLFFPIEQQFDKFFDQFFKKDLHSVGQNSSFPKLNAFEKEGQLVLTVAASGMTADDLRVEVDADNILSLSGRMSEEYHSPEDSTIYLRELRASAFERRIQLPKNIEGDPTASLKDGILTLKWKLKGQDLPKSKTKIISISTE